MKEHFFGRREYLNILRKRITDLKYGYRQNIAIIGDELIGKTTLIFGLLKDIYDTKIIPLYIETRPEDCESFAKRFIGVIFYNFLLNSGVPLREDLGFLINKSSGFIPRTSQKAAAILAALKKRKKTNLFTELLSLCELINQETGKSCVVIFDEFHNLENIGVKGIYKEWSRLLVTQKNTLYIILSSRGHRAQNILSKDLALLFGNFETLTMEPFDIKTGMEYLDFRLKARNPAPAIKNFILHFTGGYPFYLKSICDAVLKDREADISGAIEGLIFESSGVLNQRFQGYLKNLADSPYVQDYISILSAVAHGQNRLKEISQVLRKTHKEAASRINRLIEEDYLLRSGDFLKVSDRVFGFWLKFVYQERLNSLTFDAKNQKEVFRRHLETSIREFVLNSQKPISERLSEILRLFQNETLQMEKKKIRLSHFREIKPVEFPGKGLREGLLCRSNDTLWLLALKTGEVTEEDISGFANECKKYRRRLQKKIIVTFKDVDSNARLRALEEKIITWDIDKLNQVMDAFLKPRVIA